jgi:hypothetical protein
MEGNLMPDFNLEVLCNDQLYALPSDGENGKSRQVVLVPVETLLAKPFAYSFGERSAIVRALRISAASSGLESQSNMAVIPVVTRSAKAGQSSGFALFLDEGERTSLVSREGMQDKVLLPMILCLGAAVQGEGVTVWADGKTVSTVLWKENQPAIIQVTPREDAGPVEAQISFMETITGSKIESSFVMDSAENPDQALGFLATLALASLRANPALLDADLGKLPSEDSADRRRTLCRAGVAVALLGLLASFDAGVRVWNRAAEARQIEENVLSLYRKHFDPTGQVRDPLSQAKARLSQSVGEEGGNLLVAGLEFLGDAWNGAPDRLVLESLSLGSGTLKVVGTCAGADEPEALRIKAEKRFGAARLEDVSRAAGGGFRYTLTISTGEFVGKGRTRS